MKNTQEYMQFLASVTQIKETNDIDEAITLQNHGWAPLGITRDKSGDIVMCFGLHDA